MSETVCVFGCSLTTPKRRTPATWNFERNDSPWDREGFRLKNIRIRRTVSRKIACIVGMYTSNPSGQFYSLQYESSTYFQGSPWRISGNTQTHFANFSGTYHTLIERKSYILENKWTFLFAGTPLRFCFFSNGMANSEHTKEYPTNNIFPRFPKKYDLRYIILFNPLLPV